jgi:hypothetical protein
MGADFELGADPVGGAFDPPAGEEVVEIPLKLGGFDPCGVPLLFPLMSNLWDDSRGVEAQQFSVDFLIVEPVDACDYYRSFVVARQLPSLEHSYCH